MAFPPFNCHYGGELSSLARVNLQYTESITAAHKHTAVSKHVMMMLTGDDWWPKVLKSIP